MWLTVVHQILILLADLKLPIQIAMNIQITLMTQIKRIKMQLI